ncbi:MAG: ribosome-associated translation inhibitor RaiA [Lentisphaerae bacterium]|mgnify:CR=1 FL=1|jgi:putative sigma-54 modulation protein|nr:ribosome-associated translation inhibitor RaiA [Lentisphaerota bacterium]MBT4815247.1 ribosome-associated translation inhibitor RaiA [Lentisphaerota bacterium]MBT5611833.1 ribosome-associated translation inhibitor RaiA [Lentisphaerota bacterium]MBT7059290.1 ribosome-associated translation inhibitor RaiA [Lentisphaerota bacterium]MBT7843813.1 ribosome-associated translation inhibitor RaiA [Lentisphaerota bacterium]
MEVIISGRHLDIDDALREYIQEKLARLEDEYPKLTTARVVLEFERSWRVVEAHIHGKHLTLDATAKSRDFAASVDSVIDKLERQLRKHLERIQEHRLSGREQNIVNPPEEPVEDDDFEDDFELEELEEEVVETAE